MKVNYIKRIEEVEYSANIEIGAYRSEIETYPVGKPSNREMPDYVSFPVKADQRKVPSFRNSPRNYDHLGIRSRHPLCFDQERDIFSRDKN